ASSTFVTAVLAAAADSPTAAATDLAEYLVDRGMPFRDAHGVVGALVRRSLEGDAALVDLVAGHEALGPDAVPLLASGASVRRRTTRGGAGPQAVADQMERFRHRLTTDRERVEAAN
ncbi:MAG: argininosuccinate lyase, partial [Acidimicrobiales bacterium]